MQGIVWEVPLQPSLKPLRVYHKLSPMHGCKERMGAQRGTKVAPQCKHCSCCSGWKGTTQNEATSESKYQAGFGVIICGQNPLTFMISKYSTAVLYDNPYWLNNYEFYHILVKLYISLKSPKAIKALLCTYFSIGLSNYYSWIVYRVT